jgi:poly-gamma-glutamate system protein
MLIFPFRKGVGVIALVLCAALPPGGDSSRAAGDPRTKSRSGNPGLEPVDAARLMERSLASIKALRGARGLSIDRALDPNGTGIIGEEFTPLTTSLGEIEAKRTSANPAFAALMVGYFRRAGLGRGDVVAVGASGSFPALLLATLCAARVLDLQPIVIYSVGASMYGANVSGFTFVDMLERLRDDGLLPYRLAAVSPGGDGDSGGGVLFDEQGATLIAETRRAGLPVVGGVSLAERIRQRLRIYDEASAGRPIRCFVNIGGSSASFGDTEASLSLPNGLVMAVPDVPRSATRGLVFEFASRGTPIVHLLHVKGLARDNHLPFDPIPLPPVGEGDVYCSR